MIHYPPGYDVKAERVVTHHYLYPLDHVAGVSGLVGLTRGLSGPEVRRGISGVSDCVEGLQARGLAPAHPDAVPLVSSC